MKFHTAILHPNGRVFGRETRDGGRLRSDAASRRIMDEVQRLFREKLGDDPATAGKFLTPFRDLRLVLEWQQPDPLSAMGAYRAGRQTVAASFYLHGFVPELDEAVLKATEAFFARWFGGPEKARGACCGLRSITERPVMIVMPAGTSILSPSDWRMIGNLCPCFAAVFFGRAEEAIGQIDEYWHRLGFRKGGTETDYLWN